MDDQKAMKKNCIASECQNVFLAYYAAIPNALISSMNGQWRWPGKLHELLTLRKAIENKRRSFGSLACRG